MPLFRLQNYKKCEFEQNFYHKYAIFATIYDFLPHNVCAYSIMYLSLHRFENWILLPDI